MNRYLPFRYFDFLRKPSVLILAFLIVFGFSFGIYTSCISAPTACSLMRMAVSSHVSIVRIAVIVLLPFSFAAIAAFLTKPFLLYVLAYCKAFGFAFCICTICICFEQSGWLICFLLLFTDSITTAAIFLFALRHASGFGDRALLELSVLAGWCLCIGIVDVTVIFPVLSTVLIH